MSAQTLNLDVLQTQYDEISKQLKAAKKTRDARQRIVGNAILGVIEEQAETGTCRMLVDLLHRLVVNKEDRETIGLNDLVQKMDDLAKKTKTAPLSSLASASGA